VTPQLLAALRDVDRRQIDHQSPYYGPGDYVWHDGGAIPQWEQDALRDAAARKLLGEVRSHNDGKPARAVVLSLKGVQALADESSPAHGPTPHLGVGVHLCAGELVQGEIQ
jgi:hypothetical protein